MNNTHSQSGNPPPKPLAERSPILRCCRWLANPRHLGFLFGVALIMATLVMLFYVEEKLRGRWAWSRYAKARQAQGVLMDIKALPQPPVPPARNFARAPALKPLFDFAHEQKNVDTNAFQAFSERVNGAYDQAKAIGLRSFPAEGASWRKAAQPDPLLMLGERSTPDLHALARIAKSPGGQALSTNNLPATSAQAAAWILDLYQRTSGPLLDELQKEAQTRTQSSFEINLDVDEPWGILLPHLAHIKNLALQSATRASVRLYVKQVDAAFQDARLALHLADMLQENAFLISWLVRIAIREIALNPVWYGLATHQWHPAQLAELQARLETGDFFQEAHAALNAERLLNDRGIEGFLRSNKTRNCDFFGPFENEPAGDWMEFLMAIYPKGWFYHERINYDRVYARYILDPFPTNTTHVNLKAIAARMDGLDQELQGSRFRKLFVEHKYFASTFIPAVARLAEKPARAMAASTMAAAACALERHRIEQGRYPAKWSELTPKYLKQIPMDIMSGEPLKYRLNEEGAFLMYSVGQDGIDNGGQVVVSKSGFVQLQEGDWVWKYPAAK